MEDRLSQMASDHIAVITEYDINMTGGSDAFYPKSMRVWLVENTDGYWLATYIPEFDDILKYCGSSIRITGKKGIRMITSVPKALRAKLTSKAGFNGWTLLEYGTLVAWVKDYAQDDLVLDRDYSKKAYAYKKGVADPIFSATTTEIRYTNVLVGLTDEKCKPNLGMRPYMILEYKDGRTITIYGGIVKRSIGYIAYQNRHAFGYRSAAYAYIWDIIHAVYGTRYDAEYKKWP